MIEEIENMTEEEDTKEAAKEDDDLVDNILDELLDSSHELLDSLVTETEVE